jgi:osmoprotectant transport system substrate-binding protein
MKRRENVMFTARNKGRLALGAVVVGAALALSGCAAGDPLDPGSDSDSGDSDTIVIGSQAYYSNEIVAEIYAQALENAGFEVERNFQIGQRDAYLPALESGEVDLFPEYTGNLLQFYDPATTATASEDVYAALQDALPEGLTVLEQSSATDQDSYNVTAAFADQYGLSSLADLASVDVPLTLGGAPELEERPYGPSGLLERYGVTVGFSATGDTTVEDLLAGTVNIANVYSADPRIQTEDLVTLADPEGLFLASNVVPLVNADIADEIADVINAVSAALTPEGLVALNVKSTVDQESSADIATAWLTEQGLI